jgi:hydrogenase expression/formation protein HypD
MNELLRRELDRLRHAAAQLDRSVRLMEVCGSHTMAAFRTGLRSLLPDNVSLLSGPGCPVCVTPNAYIDHAIALALRPETVVATFGDMVRVPGTESSLEYARAQGGAVAVVYSPLEALRMARQQPEKQIVFLGIGFETTIPAVAWTLQEARQQGLSNYAALCGHKVIPPAMLALLQSGNQIDGFICPGHVSVIIGEQPYQPLARQHHVPCVITGFEALGMLQGIAMLLEQLVQGRAEVENQYARSVKAEGNAAALAVSAEVFAPCDAEWRGLGTIPASGLRIRPPYNDAAALPLDRELPVPQADPRCRCGEVLRGLITPPACPLFAARCTPLRPVGACMVSGEGACAAYYKYARLEQSRKP